MVGLSAIERFLERLFERPAARLFRARLQPVQIQRRIERAMETERLSGADRTLVPNAFRVRLNPVDLDPLRGIASSLAGELADSALAFARRHGYTVLDRPRVDLVSDASVEPGEVRTDASFVDRAGRMGHEALAGREVPDDTPAPQGMPTPAAAGVAVATAMPAGDRTMVFRPPAPDLPRAVLRERAPDGTERRVTLDGRAVSIGRGTDNGLVLRDGRVSRHHARLNLRQGRLVLTDLGSTNGTRVNGVSISEVALGEGDRIQVGDTILVVESVDAD